MPPGVAIWLILPTLADDQSTEHDILTLLQVFSSSYRALPNDILNA